MYTAKIQNAQGEILQLNDQENKWAVLSITGLNPAPAQLSMSEIYGMDGSRMNYAKLTARNIVIMLRLCGDVEQNRLEIYHYFPQKAPVRFFYKTRTRDVYIDGYVETIEGDLYTQNEVFQISLICPDPFFRSVADFTVGISNSQGGFEFPVAIDANDPIPFGTYESGRVTTIVNDENIDLPIDIYVRCLDAFSGLFKLQNVNTGETFAVNIVYATAAGDEWHICTDPAHIEFVGYRNGIGSNLLRFLASGSVFLQLHPGENPFGYSVNNHADNDKVEIVIKYRQLYTGV